MAGYTRFYILIAIIIILFQYLFIQPAITSIMGECSMISDEGHVNTTR